MEKTQKAEFIQPSDGFVAVFFFDDQYQLCKKSFTRKFMEQVFADSIFN